MESIKEKKVLISGASFAGLSTAYWTNKMGCKVTVVEIGSHLKMGGSPVDIKGNTVDIVKRMGLFEQIKTNRLNLESTEFKNTDDVTESITILKQSGEELPDNEFEIERDTLLNMLFDTVKNDVEFIFNNSITALNETKDHIEVTFKDGSKDIYDLVLGCDGIHSAVRKIWFGSEAEYSHFLGQYFFITIVNKSLIKQNTFQMYGVPNKGVMLNAYNNKTDIVLSFRSEHEIPYDYRDKEEQKKIIIEQFAGQGWRTAELLEEVRHSKTFYFDKFCQIKMPSWTKGRVALVGDAGYCASPAAGMGGSLAIIGATALADALEKHQGNYELAFEEYNKELRPFIEEVQAGAVNMLEFLLPRTEEEVRRRNTEGFGF
ncbi:FAD-dependent monooxygenase [Pedobacter metabolipauper]|uniref:2-polyprenyl-6-methoxyphenol hydroxylase-like FAD-dependent oxidoreductase n=1 Tax=Pedobacter metabolipauper TaxID=425513 RepID=A0A4R6T073_9SPHI|nr:FAD-dependent monooxygenase [Pedobacter metabolipauper]TDQ11745.1 2-polyprenyl-6-methoxyphenol hydroxylase-like FAD-dependent oxidoreductase [Pedobacter metabolipauper]